MNTYLSYSKILFDLLNQRTRQETVLLWKSAPFLATSGHKKHVPTKQGPSTSIKEISGLSLCSVSWDASFPVLHQQRQLFPWQHHTVCPFWCFSSAQQNHNRAVRCQYQTFFWFLWFQEQETNKTALQIKRLRAFWFVVYWQSLLLNHLVVQKEEDIWKGAVRSLIFYCPPAPSSLPGEWAVMVELAKTLLSTKAEREKASTLICGAPSKQSVSFIHPLGHGLPSQPGFMSLCLLRKGSNSFLLWTFH